MRMFLILHRELTKMNSPINDSHSDVTIYGYSLYRFVLYDGIRILQMIIGFVGNGVTLHIIRNLKVLTNEHILMIYTATSNILTNCMVPPATYTSVMGTFKNRPKYWMTLCIWTDYVYVTVSSFSLVSYFVLSVDR